MLQVGNLLYATEGVFAWFYEPFPELDVSQERQRWLLYDSPCGGGNGNAVKNPSHGM